MILGEKSNKRTKSHSVKKSEIFCYVSNFEIHLRKRKNLRKRRVYAGFGADNSSIKAIIPVFKGFVECQVAIRLSSCTFCEFIPSLSR